MHLRSEPETETRLAEHQHVATMAAKWPSVAEPCPPCEELKGPHNKSRGGRRAAGGIIKQCMSQEGMAVGSCCNSTRR